MNPFFFSILKPFFNKTISTNHKSHNPSPWAAYAFHPIEGVIEAGILLVIAFVMPFHPLALLVFFLFSFAYNVLGHLGYEVFPEGMNKHWLGRWINTSTNHNMHHKYSRGNYGFYFTFWDNLMGTTHHKYHETFEKITKRKKETKNKEETTQKGVLL